MSHHNNSNIFSVILFSFFSFLFFTAFIFFFIIRYSYNFINKYYSVFCIHKIFGIQKFFVNKYYSVLVIRKFFIKEDIWSSVFGNFSWTKIFDLRSSEIFHERRSSVFGIRKFLKNEDLRSSVFGNFSWTKIFGLRYLVKITLRCNSAINPDRLVGKELYHLCKGSKTVQISPIDIGLACYDELHMDINMPGHPNCLPRRQNWAVSCPKQVGKLARLHFKPHVWEELVKVRFYPIARLREEWWYPTTSLLK